MNSPIRLSKGLPFPVIDQIARHIPFEAHLRLIQLPALRKSILATRFQCLTLYLEPGHRRPKHSGADDWGAYHHQLVQDILSDFPSEYLGHVRNIRLIRHVSWRCQQLGKEVVLTSSNTVHLAEGFRTISIEIYESSYESTAFDLHQTAKGVYNRQDLIVSLWVFTAWSIAVCFVILDAFAIDSMCFELGMLFMCVDCGLMLVYPPTTAWDFAAVLVATYAGAQFGRIFRTLFEPAASVYVLTKI